MMPGAQQDLSEELKQLIDRYLDGHRTRSLATLSRSSGVSYTTIRRFAQKEGQPTAEPVLKIVDATLGDADKIDFLRRHFPEIARSIAKTDAGQYKRKDPTPDAWRTCCSRDPHNMIFHMASTTAGTSVERVQALCGSRGLDAVDEMVDLGLLLRDFTTGEIRTREDTELIVDCDIALNHIERSVRYFDRNLIGTEYAKIGQLTASLNRDGLKRIHGILSDAVAEIFATKDDPRYAGQVPFYLNFMMNVYDRHALDKLEGEDHE